ncbi:helix-turn-helix domain-containing protein [Vibrio penaeicida]|uniref:AraC family transcriptional regulator n=1 Tax=Vibrio penaeicida TaxID=104609 RepID=A0AAV5P0A5_9VIBR|nr:helix-turn-helix domain-containing protein [Vibrio penaeicida]RTZ22658.1 helix-turn-helix domain-containing protein [Vibrio penaeicida]GLQ76194.1 AraC family transcriptional regulator [Vibrio penaeicida]
MSHLISQLQELVEHIESHLDEDIDIALLAKRFSMSPWHFQRMFKGLIGDTLGGYIRGRKLTRAAQQLIHTELGIIDIALNVGFGSHEAFTRSFKHYFSITPKQFRQQSPVVNLREKPVLTQSLFSHLNNGMKLEPQIIHQPELLLVGFETTIPSPFTFEESFCDLLEAPWMQLLGRREELKHAKDDTYYGLTISPSGTFLEDEVTYLSAMEVSDRQLIPSDMKTHRLPQQEIAVFEVEEVSEDSVGKTMDYIYGYWLPNSEYERGTGQDYELFENLKNFTLPEMKSKYIIPIRSKTRS